MNAQPRQASAPAPSLVPIARRPLRPGALAVLLILLTVSAVALGAGVASVSFTFPLPTYVPQIICGVALLLMLIYLWRLSPSKVGPIALTALSVGCVLLTGNPALAAPLVSTVFLIGFGGMAIAVLPTKQLLFLPLVPLASYAITLALCRDPLLSLAVLLPVPAAPAMAMATRRSAGCKDGPGRVGVICLASLVLGATVVAFVAGLLLRGLGTLSPAMLGRALEELRTALVGYFATVEFPAEMAENEDFRAFWSEENLTYMVNGFFNLVPGYFVAGMNILAAAAQILFLDGLTATEHGDSVTDRVKVFRISLVSGVVFAIAYIVAIIADWEGSTLAGAVAQNIYIILLPGLALAGFLRLNASLLRRGGGGAGCLFLLLVLVPCFLLVAPPLLAVFEVGGQVASFLRERLKPPEDDDIFRRPPDDRS